MLDDPYKIQATLAHYDRREADMQRQLAYFETHGPKQTYTLLKRAYEREQQAIQVRRKWLASLTIDNEKTRNGKKSQAFRTN